MSIWFKKDLDIEQMRPIGKNTMSEHLAIEWVKLGEDHLEARMPVDHRTKQPYGLLHGGASCVLAETLGSVCSAMVIDPERYICVGIEINANHIRSVRDGFVSGIVRPIHLGRQTHVWDIRITDEEDRLVCVSRLTVAVLARP